MKKRMRWISGFEATIEPYSNRCFFLVTHPIQRMCAFVKTWTNMFFTIHLPLGCFWWLFYPTKTLNKKGPFVRYLTQKNNPPKKHGILTNAHQQKINLIREALRIKKKPFTGRSILREADGQCLESLLVTWGFGSWFGTEEVEGSWWLLVGGWWLGWLVLIWIWLGLVLIDCLIVWLIDWLFGLV